MGNDKGLPGRTDDLVNDEAGPADRILDPESDESVSSKACHAMSS